MKPYYVMHMEHNSEKLVPYDIMPYLIDQYIKARVKDRPKTFEDSKKFVEGESMYQFWARCEYEFLVSDWPNNKKAIKVDVYQQIKMNLDIVTEVFMENVKALKPSELKKRKKS